MNLKEVIEQSMATPCLTGLPVNWQSTMCPHVTAETATIRNRFVAALAAAVAVAHAAPGSKIEALSIELLAVHKRLYTFDHPANSTLIQAGARVITPETNWI